MHSWSDTHIDPSDSMINSLAPKTDLIVDSPFQLLQLSCKFVKRILWYIKVTKLVPDMFDDSHYLFAE